MSPPPLPGTIPRKPLWRSPVEPKPKRNPAWPDRTINERQAEIQKRYKIIYNLVMEQAVALGYPRTTAGIQGFMRALEHGQVQIEVKKNE